MLFPELKIPVEGFFPDVRQYLDVLNPEKLTDEELESMINTTTGSLNGCDPVEFEDDDFILPDDAMEDANLIFTYITLCRLQAKMLNRVMLLTTQGFCQGAIERGELSPLESLHIKIDHIAYLVGSIRPKLMDQIQLQLNKRLGHGET